MTNKKSEAIKLMNDYKDIENKRIKALLTIEEFKKQHEEIFNTLESLEYEVELLDRDKSDVVPLIKDAMVKENKKKEEIGKFRFTYVAPTIKRNFDSKKFYENYSPKTKMYKEYVTQSNVSDYVKVKELIYKDNNENDN